MASLTSHIKMSCDEWVALPDNPLQRDTQRHAAKAKHLLTPLSVHAVVAAARLPNGKMIKLDGHTRALLWHTGVVPKPKQIEVHVYEVADKEGAAALYKTFDSKDALETTPDKVSGALKGMGYAPQSGLIASGAFNSALTISWQAVYGYAFESKARDVYEAINEFAAEIIAIDDLALRKGQIKTGIMAAIIVSFRKHGDKIMPFWRAVVADGGTKSAGKMDAVQAVSEMMLSKAGSGAAVSRDIAARALTAAEAWLNDETFFRIPRPLDITSYLETAAHKKGKFKLVRKVKTAEKAKNGSAHAAA